MINPNDPAFPQSISFCEGNTTPLAAVDHDYRLGGLPIRAELSARAMQAFIGMGWRMKSDYNTPSKIAELSCKYADALISELNKT